MDINLLVDTNNLFNRAVKSLPSYARLTETKIKFDDEIELASEEEVDLCVDSVNGLFNKFLKEIPPVSRIIFLQDSSSWRKKVIIDGDTSYKKRRKERKGKKMNWENFEKVFDKFMEMNPDYYNYRVNGLEADDLIYLTCSKLKKKFPNDLNIIYSTDSDFQQLLDNRNVIYNPIYTSPRFILNSNYDISTFKKIDNNGPLKNKPENKSKDPFDISGFNFKNNINMDSETIISKIEDKHHIEYVDGKISIFEKFICGDDKDDVPSSYSWKSGETIKRITPKYIEPILEKFNQNDIDINMSDILTKENVQIVKEVVETINKNSIDIPLKQLANNLKRNRLLLYLSHKTIPEKLINKFEEIFDSDFN